MCIHILLICCFIRSLIRSSCTFHVHIHSKPIENLIQSKLTERNIQGKFDKQVRFSLFYRIALKCKTVFQNLIYFTFNIYANECLWKSHCAMICNNYSLVLSIISIWFALFIFSLFCSSVSQFYQIRYPNSGLFRGILFF